MTVLLRADVGRDDPGDLPEIRAWLSRLGVRTRSLRAFAVEAPSTSGPDEYYLLHLTRYVRRPDGSARIDPATGEIVRSHRTVRIPVVDLPPVRERSLTASGPR